MSRISMRKVVTAGMGAALIGSGLTVGLGAGVASAAPACEQIVTNTGGSSTAQYRVTQTALSADVPVGGEITYQTSVSSVSGVPALIKGIGQFHPAGLTPVSARSNVAKVIGGAGWNDEELVEDATQNFTSVYGGGWNVTGGNIATVEITYKVTGDFSVGDQLRSGSAFDRVSVSGPVVFKDSGACVTIRGKNPIEAGAGSLDGLGLGSVNSGSGQVFGSLTDPQGSMTNIISGVLGNVLGNMS